MNPTPGERAIEMRVAGLIDAVVVPEVTKFLRQVEAAARAEEREANCKATCVCCENGDPLIQPKYQGGVLEHEVTTLDNKRLLVRCRAEGIRARD